MGAGRCKMSGNLWFCPPEYWKASKVVHATHPDYPGEPLCGQEYLSEGEFWSQDYEHTKQQAEMVGVNIDVINCKKCLKKLAKGGQNG